MNHPYHHRPIWFFVLTCGGVIAAIYLAAMIDYFPFIANDLVVREVMSCTLIIAMLLAICTNCIILSIHSVHDSSQQGKNGDPGEGQEQDGFLPAAPNAKDLAEKSDTKHWLRV